MTAGLTSIGWLEVVCLLLAIVGIGCVIIFTDVAGNPPEKVPRSQRQAWAAARVIEEAREGFRMQSCILVLYKNRMLAYIEII